VSRFNRPTKNAFAPFSCERGYITDVNHKTFTCSIQTDHARRTLRDVPWATPYAHPAAGEGFHFVPEVGAACYLARPVDGTPPFILCFIGIPSVLSAKGNDPIRQNTAPGGGTANVSYQSNRPELIPGDIGFTGRDGNFVLLRRGGILQMGSTPLAQRVTVPIRNFVHDYFENYEMAGPAGEMAWLVERAEFDPAGHSACSWSLTLREYASDAKASVRVRYMPLGAKLGKKAAWEVTVAPQGIDMGPSGSTGIPSYTLSVLMDGTATEMIGASRTVTVLGDDHLNVAGSRSVRVGAAYSVQAGGVVSFTGASIALSAANLSLGDASGQPAVLGNALAQLLTTGVADLSTGKVTFSPPDVASILSKTVKIS
jgi:hypothetical protein